MLTSNKASSIGGILGSAQGVGYPAEPVGTPMAAYQSAVMHLDTQIARLSELQEHLRSRLMPFMNQVPANSSQPSGDVKASSSAEAVNDIAELTCRVRQIILATEDTLDRLAV